MTRPFKVLVFFAILFTLANCLKLFGTPKRLSTENDFQDIQEEEAMEYEVEYESEKEEKEQEKEEEKEQEYKPNIIDIDISASDNPEIIKGQKGAIVFKINCSDTDTLLNSSDIEDSTTNYTNIKDKNGNTYEFECRLCKIKNDDLILVCENVDKDFDIGTHEITVDDYYLNNFDETIFKVAFDKNGFKLQKVDKVIPFIYSEDQTINIEEGKESYSLIFKLGNYNNELFILGSESYTYFIMDNCTINGKELRCPIEKSVLEERLKDNSEQTLDMNYFDEQENTEKDLPYIGEIVLKYTYDIQKENINVQITKLLQTNVNQWNSIAYETNVTDISNVYLEFSINSHYGSLTCSLKKAGEKPLLFICSVDNKEETFYLGDINEVQLDQHNIKYNFYLLPGSNNELAEIKGLGSYFKVVSPSVLDFENNKEITIRYFMDDPENTKRIRINPDSDDLDCAILNKEIAKCVVPKSHFENKKSGYYYTHHSNINNEFIIPYELSPFKVILPEEKNIVLRIKKENNPNIVQIGQKGTILFVTNYNDNEAHIFNDDEVIPIEAESSIVDGNKNEYKVRCKLWNPKNIKMRILCNLESKLESSKYIIYIKDISFKYKDYDILIKQDESLEIEQKVHEEPFLYSDNQIINMNDNKQTYELTFNYESYQNEILYIYGNQHNYEVLDNCKNENDKINCIISREKIEEILTLSNEKFKIGAIKEDFGIIQFDNIFDITIIYENVEKRSIELKVTRLLSSINEANSFYAFETDFTEDLPNFISVKDKLMFKKMTGRPLMILMDNTQTDIITGGSTWNNIHYKYDFIIKASEIQANISIEGNGTNILLTYPQELDFTNQTSLNIYYIMPEPNLVDNIKLNPNSKSDLSCSNLIGMKKCTVPDSHFKRGESGNFDTYHKNHEGDYIIYYESPRIEVNIPKIVFNLNINQEDNYHDITVGDKGIIYFKTDYNNNKLNIFNDSDIEKISFPANIKSSSQKTYAVNCKLWEPKIDNLYLICKLIDNLEIYDTKIILEETTFDYNDYIIKTVFNMNYLSINVVNGTKPFLYWDEQDINLEDSKDNYELKFKIGEYNNEPLLLIGDGQTNLPYHLYLKNCSQVDQELICKIEKNEFAEINGEKYGLFSIIFGENSYESFDFPLNFGININSNLTKETIYIDIKKLLVKEAEMHNFIAYETNSTDSLNLLSTPFSLNITNKDSDLKHIECFFKKTTNKPLLIVCDPIRGEYHLNEIKEQIQLNDINMKYNFIIQPVNNEEIIKIYDKESTSVLGLALPEKLDFTSQDNISIFYLIRGAENTKRIRLNIDSDDLNCTKIVDALLKCVVPKSHFENKKSGYYYTHHLNVNGEFIPFYEYSPLEVILPEDKTITLRIQKQNNESPIIIGKEGIISLVTNYNDNERGIFNESKEISFDTIIIDEEKNQYNSNCKLWIPNNGKIRVLCSLKEPLKNNNTKIILSEKSIEYYGRYNISIKQEPEELISIEQKEYHIPFLYSDEQTINIDDKESTYELTFNKESYENDILYIYGEGNNYAVLDNCGNNEATLYCKLTKSKLEEILRINEERFKIGSMNDNVGIIKFNHIFDIIIKYENITKENIYIQIEKLVGGISEDGTPIAYETNITEFSNFVSLAIKNNCYLKKVSGRPLMYYCITDEDFEGWVGEKDRLIYNDRHYKYNFIINPYNIQVKISIEGNGTNIKLTYPEELNFKSEDPLYIRYIMDQPSLAKNIKLNPNSTLDLECDDLIGMKKCKVPETHFEDMESDNYDAYHKNHEGDYIIYNEAIPIKVILPNNKIKLRIKEEDNTHNMKVGDQGIMYFVTDYNDMELNIFNDSSLEEFTFITNVVTNKNKDYNITCRLWEPKNESIHIICKFDDILSIDEKTIKLQDTSFKFNDYEIKIDFIKDTFKISIYNGTLPFLYWDKININLLDNVDVYEFRLKIGDYHNETLILYQSENELATLFLDDCLVEKKELICKVNKDELIGVTLKNRQKFSLRSLILGENGFEFVNFKLNYGVVISSNLNKETINVDIKKLLEKEDDGSNFIAYETNVTNISNIFSDKFELSFLNRESDTQYEQKEKCYFRKKIGQPLLIICQSQKGEFSLGEIEENIELNDLNVKYNFVVQPVFNNEIFKIDGDEQAIGFMSTNILDFTLNDQISVLYLMKNSEKSFNLRINPDSDNLNCEEIETSAIKCIVPKSHFENKQNGYYYTHHINHVNKFTQFYESYPFKVILPEDNNNITLRIKKENNPNTIKVGKEGIIVLVTNYDDNQRKIFSKGEEILFNDTINDANDASCKLWVPEEGKVRIICTLNKPFENNQTNIILGETSFEYEKYNIVIKQEQEESIEIEQTEYHIPILYSNEQIINIDENKQSYELIFNIGSYINEDILYIYGEANNYAALDNCKSDEKKITCDISKEKIESILVNSNEQFKIGAINDNIGLIDFAHVLDIIVVYENVKREDINITITKIVGTHTEKGTPYGYETNITDFPNFISGKNYEDCYFKKISGKPLTLYCYFKKDINEDDITIGVREGIYKYYHYKYKFNIIPFEIPVDVSVEGDGTDIKLTYPEKLDFASKNSAKIRYIITEPIKYPNIKLNTYSSSDLICKDFTGVKICDVPMEHFERKSSGVFYTHHLNHKGDYVEYCDTVPIEVSLPYEILEINIEMEDNKDDLIAGQKGTIYFVTNYNDKEKNIFNSSDIEEKTSFDTNIEVGKNSYNVNCRLWKPTDGKLFILCKLDVIFNSGEYYINIPNIQFDYDKYKIYITSNVKNIKLLQLSKTLPFLYSDKQTINFEEGKETYDLKLKLEGEYKNELLFLSGEELTMLMLENCKEEGKELICPVDKNKLEEIASGKGQEFKVFLYDPEEVGKYELNTILDITLDYEITKEIIKVNITDLLVPNIYLNNFVAYKINTDKNDISNLMTIPFELNFINTRQQRIPFPCRFKKSTSTDLLLICQFDQESTYSLQGLEEEIKLENISIKYDFQISTVSNDNKFTITGNGNYILYSYPAELDFYSKEKITINYIIKEPVSSEEIKINLDSNDLICKNVKFGKECIVPITHFDNKGTNYYNTYHKISNDENYIIHYELSPIHVKLPEADEVVMRITLENNKEEKEIGEKGVLVFITDYNDEAKQIFNNTDWTEENIEFDTKIKDENNNEYNTKCKLWEPDNDNIRIICKLEENLKQREQNIILEGISYDYEIKNKTIIISQIESIKVEQLDYPIPFLFSNEQSIEINKENENGTLKFIVESYNNDILYIYGENENYAILDECGINGKFLECELSLEAIDKFLTKKSEQFKVGAMDDNKGLIEFDNILKITINNNYYDNKITINANLTKLVTQNTEINTYFGFETDYINENITLISSIKKIDKETDCHFRKYGDEEPLMLLCKTSINKDKFNFEFLKKEFENIHFKYDINIEFDDTLIQKKVEVKESGTYIRLVYPDKLDFTKDNSLTIRYIMKDPLSGKNIKLNNETKSELSCTNLKGMKKCTVPFVHFIRQNSGTYYTQHSINDSNTYLRYYESPPIQVTLSDEEIIEVKVESEDNQHTIQMGENGMIYFMASYNLSDDDIFEESDLEDKTEFSTSIFTQNNMAYDATCRLWKYDDNSLRIFCKLLNTENINDGYIKIGSQSFMFKGKKIGIISEMDYTVEIRKLRTKMPFIYALEQTIKVENGKEDYEIKLKALEFNNEKLILTNLGHKNAINHIVLDKCNKNGKDITCSVTKERIEEILGKNDQEYGLTYLDENIGIAFILNNVLNIKINYESIEKENVYIQITNVLENKTSVGDFAAYQTNVTKISNVISNIFLFNVREGVDVPCFMKKSEDKHLIILCKVLYPGQFTLPEIKNTIEISDINIKYNFLVQPVKNEDIININENGGSAVMYYPTILDFNSGNTLKVQFFTNRNDYDSLKLNMDSNINLNCNRVGQLQTCDVPLSHFDGKESGYYYIYHNNNYNGYSVYYELTPIKVILPIIIKVTDAENQKIGENGAIAFKTDFLDDKGRFDPKEIEKIELGPIFKDENDINYTPNCHLWEIEGEKLRLICKFNKKITGTKLELIKKTFKYNNEEITILSEGQLKVEQLNSRVAFLYSDKQTIEINDNETDYELIFKKEVYNKESLLLYKKINHDKKIFINLDCTDEEKEVKCTIKKEKLLETLFKKEESYYLSQLTESEGELPVDNVLEIKVKYDIQQKKDISVNIIKLLTTKLEKNSFIVYETNITKNIGSLTTDYFDIAPNKNGNTWCLFKKYSDKDTLLLLCEAETSGESQLGKITELEIKEANALYNFIIPETTNNDKYTVSNVEGPRILSVNPLSLNFSLSDSFIIKYQVENSDKFKGIKLNTEAKSELDCKDEKGIVSCNVTKAHLGKKGEYHTYYNDSFGGKSIAYEIPTIDVYIKEDEKSGGNEDDGGADVGLIVGLVIAGVVIIAVVVFFIVKAYRKKNDIDTISGKNDNILPASAQVELKGEGGDNE